MPVYLEGIAVQFYRGIGPETQYIAPFAGMNFFVGANNAGKSVVLNLIKDRLPFGEAKAFARVSKDTTETYRGAEEGQTQLSLGIAAETFEARMLQLFRKLQENHFRHKFQQRLVEEGLTAKQMLDEHLQEFNDISSYLTQSHAIWASVEDSKSIWRFQSNPIPDELRACLSDAQWVELARLFRVGVQLDLDEKIKAVVLSVLKHFAFDLNRTGIPKGAFV